jgi:hypothetical protein
LNILVCNKNIKNARKKTRSIPIDIIKVGDNKPLKGVFCMARPNNAEIIYVDNILQKKVGAGGLPQHVIDAADKRAKSIQLDIDGYIKTRFQSLKKSSDIETMNLNAQNDNFVDVLLGDIVPINVNSKLKPNHSLTIVSNNLLRFMTSLNQLNIDAHHVLKAHVKAMDLIITKNIETGDNDIVMTLMKELNLLCDRYMSKYKTLNG